MKKFALAFVFFVGSVVGSSSLFAQENAVSGGSGVRLGLEAGFDLSNLNGPNVNDVFGSRLGFVGGAFLGLPLAPTLSIQPELLYSQKGGKYNGYDYQLNYWEVPILLDVTLVGPLGILLGPSFDSTAANNAGAGSGINNSDIGLILGAQLNFDRFLFSGRYEFGLTNVTNSQSVQNGTFTFMAGLSFI